MTENIAMRHPKMLHVVRAEETGLLSRGLGPALLRAAPLHGLVFLGYATTLSI